jgi:hypothetical protein
MSLRPVILLDLDNTLDRMRSVLPRRARADAAKADRARHRDEGEGRVRSHRGRRHGVHRRTQRVQPRSLSDVVLLHRPHSSPARSCTAAEYRTIGLARSCYAIGNAVFTAEYADVPRSTGSARRSCVRMGFQLGHHDQGRSGSAGVQAHEARHARHGGCGVREPHQDSGGAAGKRLG